MFETRTVDLILTQLVERIEEGPRYRTSHRIAVLSVTPKSAKRQQEIILFLIGDQQFHGTYERPSVLLVLFIVRRVFIG